MRHRSRAGQGSDLPPRLVISTCAALARPRTARGVGGSPRVGLLCSFLRFPRIPAAPRGGSRAPAGLASWRWRLGRAPSKQRMDVSLGDLSAHPVRAAASSKRCASRAARWNASACGAESGASGAAPAGAAAAAVGPASRRSMYAAARRGQASAPSAANVACPPPHTASARRARPRGHRTAGPPASRTA